MVVVIETVLAEVGDEQVRVAVVVVVADGYAKPPTVVGDSCFGGNIGEGAVVVVVEECGVRRLRFAGQGVVGGAVHHVNVEPAVLVIVEEGDAGPWRLEDESLFGSAHGVMPGGQAGLGSNVLKDHGTGCYEAAGGNRPLFGVEHGRVGAARVYATHGLRLFLDCGAWPFGGRTQRRG